MRTDKTVLTVLTLVATAAVVVLLSNLRDTAVPAGGLPHGSPAERERTERDRHSTGTQPPAVDAPDPGRRVAPRSDGASETVSDGVHETVADGDTRLLSVRDRRPLERAQAATVLVWSRGADPIGEGPSTQLSIAVGAVAEIEVDGPTRVQAAARGAISAIVDLDRSGLGAPGEPVVLELRSVLECVVDLVDVATGEYPEYDRFAPYPNPLAPVPTGALLARRDRFALRIAGVADAVGPTDPASSPIPSRFHLLNHRTDVAARRLAYRVELDGYHPVETEVVAAPLGDPTGHNVVWVSRLGDRPHGEVLVRLTDRRRLFLDHGSNLPAPAEFVLHPRSDDAGTVRRSTVRRKAVRRKVARGSGALVRLAGIPAGAYELSLRGPSPASQYPLEGGDVVSVDVGGGTVEVEFALDDIAALRLVDLRAADEDVGGAVLCTLFEGVFSVGQSAPGVALHFDRAPYVVPIAPVGDHSVMISAGGVGYGVHNVTLEPGVVTEVAFGR